MKVSTRDRYALHLMPGVVLHSHNAAVSLRDVTQRQGVLDKYLEQIVTQLSRVGLVYSVRGAGGGYLLTHEPEEYTMGETLRMLEDNPASVNRVDQDDTCRCSQADRCVTIKVRRDIQTAVSSVMDRLTLADLVRRYRGKYSGHSVQNSLK